MIKSPVYDELAQAAAFSLSSISRIFMANCSSVKGFCRKRLRKSCFCQRSSRDVRRKDSEFGWGMVPCGVLPPYRIRRYLRPSLFLLAIATYRYCLRHGDWKKHCLCSVVAMIIVIAPWMVRNYAIPHQGWMRAWGQLRAVERWETTNGGELNDVQTVLGEEQKRQTLWRLGRHGSNTVCSARGPGA